MWKDLKINIMNLDTIKTELKEYILDSINDYDDVDKLKIINNIYLNELHHELFNIDYYIIYLLLLE